MPAIPRPTRLLCRLGAVTAAVTVAGVALGAPASAHVTIVEQSASAGAYTVLTFSVPHGCDGSATTGLRIQVPESIPSVTPTVNDGWEVEKVMEQLDTPIEGGHGEQITERVAEVAYTASTPLEDGFRDTFELSLQLPADAAGTTIYFPVIQQCGEAESAWIERPAEDGAEPELPAPGIEVTAPGDAAESPDDGAEVWGIAGLGTGVAGLAVGGIALARTRRT